MRIAYLVSLYPATSHTFIRREIVMLRKAGLHIDSFSIRKPPSDPKRASAEFAAESGQTFYVLAATRRTGVAAHLWAVVSHPARYFSTLGVALTHRVPGAKSLVWALFHFAESIVLAREIRRRGIDRIHNHFANSAATVGMLASRFLNIPWSLTLHGISETDYPAGLLLGRKIETAQFVACVSWFGRAQAMRVTSPDQWHKFAIVRCGIDLAELPERRTASNLAGRPARILCVGRLSPEKGQAGLLEAFSKVLERGHAAQLILVGDGPDRAMLEARAKDLGLTEVTTFTGRLDEAATLVAISQCDVLVSSSFMEGLPVVLMEAMALDVCVVASRVAGIPELVEDGRTGYLFTPANWSELADKIELAITDQKKQENIRVDARKLIESDFAIDKAVVPMIDLLRQI